MRTIPAGEFKTKCLALMDEVNATGQTLVITKRGKPVAKLAPADQNAVDRPIFGAMRGKAVLIGDVVSPLFSDEELEHMQERSSSILGETGK